MPLTPICKDPELLCPCVQRLHSEMLSAAIARNVYPVTVETLRALDRQEYYVKIGVSWSLDSFHLPQPPQKLSLAFDVCPQEYLSHPLWNPEGEEWDVLIGLAETLGLQSGYKLWNKDKPHYHLTKCECTH